MIPVIFVIGLALAFAIGWVFGAFFAEVRHQAAPGAKPPKEKAASRQR